jgi:hypothetical protein
MTGCGKEIGIEHKGKVTYTMFCGVDGLCRSCQAKQEIPHFFCECKHELINHGMNGKCGLCNCKEFHGKQKSKGDFITESKEIIDAYQSGLFDKIITWRDNYWRVRIQKAQESLTMHFDSASYLQHEQRYKAAVKTYEVFNALLGQETPKGEAKK